MDNLIKYSICALVRRHLSIEIERMKRHDGENGFGQVWIKKKPLYAYPQAGEHFPRLLYAAFRIKVILKASK